MRIIYILGIDLFTFGIRIAALFNSKCRKMVQGWKEALQLIQQSHEQRPTAWFHASSLGEFEQARPVLERFHELHPDHQIWVTFFSPSGYELRKDYPLADHVCYLPMDSRKNARTLVESINPNIVFIAKYDFWFNYLDELRRHNVPTYIFSALFRPNQYFFKFYGRWFLHQLQYCFTHIFVQNEESLKLLQNHDIISCSIAGDTRFDRVNAVAQNAKHFPEIEQLIGNRKVLLAGSSWEPDEKFLKQYYDHRRGNIQLILAPHVIAESHLQSIEQLFGKEHCLRYSKLIAENRPPIQSTDAHPIVLIIDNIGMLQSLYQYASVAYIGGGWGKSIHNTQEALTFDKPVVFGPKYKKFREAVSVIALGGGWSYNNYNELEQVLDPLFDNPEHNRQASRICRQYVEDNLGATETILSKTNI